MTNASTREKIIHGSQADAGREIYYRVRSCMDTNCINVSDPSLAPSISLKYLSLNPAVLDLSTAADSGETASSQDSYTSQDGVYTLRWNSAAGAASKYQIEKNRWQVQLGALFLFKQAALNN